jgi:hypothetical protein
MVRMNYAIAFALALVMALGLWGVASAAVPTDTGETTQCGNGRRHPEA